MDLIDQQSNTELKFIFEPIINLNFSENIFTKLKFQIKTIENIFLFIFRYAAHNISVKFFNLTSNFDGL